jgi:hypothetical protein
MEGRRPEDMLSDMEHLLGAIRISLEQGGSFLINRCAPNGPIMREPNVSYIHKASWGMYAAGVEQWADGIGIHPYSAANPPWSHCCNLEDLPGYAEQEGYELVAVERSPRAVNLFEAVYPPSFAELWRDTSGGPEGRLV